MSVFGVVLHDDDNGDDARAPTTTHTNNAARIEFARALAGYSARDILAQEIQQGVEKVVQNPEQAYMQRTFRIPPVQEGAFVGDMCALRGHAGYEKGEEGPGGRGEAVKAPTHSHQKPLLLRSQPPCTQLSGKAPALLILGSSTIQFLIFMVL